MFNAGKDQGVAKPRGGITQRRVTKAAPQQVQKAMVQSASQQHFGLGAGKHLVTQSSRNSYQASQHMLQAPQAVAARVFKQKTAAMMGVQ